MEIDVLRNKSLVVEGHWIPHSSPFRILRGFRVWYGSQKSNCDVKGLWLKNTWFCLSLHSMSVSRRRWKKCVGCGNIYLISCIGCRWNIQRLTSGIRIHKRWASNVNSMRVRRWGLDIGNGGRIWGCMMWNVYQGE